MPMTKVRIIITLIALLLLATPAHAQQKQPASVVGGGFVVTIAPEFHELGKGGTVNASVNLPGNFTVTEDAQFIAERKSYERSGSTKGSLTGLNYYGLPSGLFVRAALSTGAHSNQNETVVRLHVGGGWQMLDRTSWLPLFGVTGVAVWPLKDSHGGRGFKITPVVCNSLYKGVAVCADANIEYLHGHDFQSPKRFAGFSSSIGVKIVLQLSHN